MFDRHFEKGGNFFITVSHLIDIKALLNFNLLRLESWIRLFFDSLTLFYFELYTLLAL